VIISGDSDFSPLVSKLRENAKMVIGVGVKNSTSDLLMNNCDEFIFYDDLVRASDSAPSRRPPPAKTQPAADKKPAKTAAPAAKAAMPEKVATPEKAGTEAERRDEAVALVVETAEGLFAERGDRVWGSMVKQTLKRRRPGFNESFYGFRSFSELLEEAEDRELFDLELDERSGGYVIQPVRHED
jgi:hypothetical protein